ncbi:MULTISPECIES: beta-Ala-His dipeptidase [Cysteiniphilum]|uniref:beta-Ala-His dipeptidase n=2 Tax=Fastidiosibacteraceae TaxID=2056687 RepID=UPI0017868D86|nr:MULTISPECIES: beta-Ala-His dipeptidase [Cysteiniphilum]
MMTTAVDMVSELNIETLKNESIWQYFIEITQIPRPTFHEEKIKAYLLEWAKNNNFKTKIDQADNIAIYVPATKGYESHKPVVLQAHKDMVCEKNEEVTFDFLNDSLQLEIVDGWLKAKGTTLGADNGIGIAAAMAAATDKDIKRPALEILITASEERGLIGANNLSKDLLTANTMINLDTESWGDIYVGCAGSQSATMIFKNEIIEQSPSLQSIEIIVNGLKGGHSGLDIDKPRINAAKFMSMMLDNLDQNHSYNINEIKAGNLPNAIPREAKAIISCQVEDIAQIKEALTHYYHNWFAIYQKNEPNFALTIKEVTMAKTAFNDDLKSRLLNVLTSIHSGVLAMSPAMPNLVESSNNVSSIKLKDDDIVITIYTRSDNNLAINNFMQSVKRIAAQNNAIFNKSQLSPGWKPDMSSNVLKIAKDSYFSLYSKEANIKAIHAGLECGAIVDKYPHMDMVSIGPSIEGAHSPDEKVKINTVSEFYQLLKAMLERL